MFRLEPSVLGSIKMTNDQTFYCWIKVRPPGNYFLQFTNLILNRQTNTWKYKLKFKQKSCEWFWGLKNVDVLMLKSHRSKWIVRKFLGSPKLIANNSWEDVLPLWLAGGAKAFFNFIFLSQEPIEKFYLGLFSWHLFPSTHEALRALTE